MPNSAPKPVIVIVEDDRALAALVAEQLQIEGYNTQLCYDAEHAQQFLEKQHASLVLLDVGLPGLDGFALMKNLQAKNIHTPIIFVTGNDMETDKVRALNMGGDDYLNKPFSFAELLARIRAVLRRSEHSGDWHVAHNTQLLSEPFEFCGATVIPATMEIELGNTRESIGRKELGILNCLAANPRTVLTRRAIIHAVWGVHADVKSRSLDQYLVKLRERYQSKGYSLASVRTVHGVGFVYEPVELATGTA